MQLSLWIDWFRGFCWEFIGVSAASEFGEGCQETRGNVGKATRSCGRQDICYVLRPWRFLPQGFVFDELYCLFSSIVGALLDLILGDEIGNLTWVFAPRLIVTVLYCIHYRTKAYKYWLQCL